MGRGSFLRTRLVLRPGRKGTKKLVAEYGDRLLCVRYRYDSRTRRRLKTVELVVDEVTWEPPSLGYCYVGVRIGFAEEALRSKVKAAGARWRKEEKLWEMTYDQAVRMGLKKRITRSL